MVTPPPCSCGHTLAGHADEDGAVGACKPIYCECKGYRPSLPRFEFERPLAECGLDCYERGRDCDPCPRCWVCGCDGECAEPELVEPDREVVDVDTAGLT